jgi:hypothetical protein
MRVCVRIYSSGGPRGHPPSYSTHSNVGKKEGMCVYSSLMYFMVTHEGYS